MITKLIVVRHGQTDWNPIHRIQGLTDTELNETGIRQMVDAALKLKDEKIDIIYTSDLKRCYKSADIVNSYHGVPVVRDKDLGELNQGQWQGRLVNDLERSSEDYRLWQRNPMLVTPPGGEHIKDFADKVISKVWKIIEEHEGKTICIVSHEVTNAVLRCYFNKIDLSQIWDYCPSNVDVDVYEIPAPELKTARE